MTPELAEHRYPVSAPVRPPSRGQDDLNRPVFYLHPFHRGAGQFLDAVLGSAILARLQRPVSSSMAALIKQIGTRAPSQNSQGNTLAVATSYSSSRSSLGEQVQAGSDKASGTLCGPVLWIHQRDGEQHA